MSAVGIDGATATALAAQAAQFTVADLWRRSARLFADRVAITCDELELTYAQVDERTGRLARALADAGIGRADRVAVMARTRPEFIELYLAAGKLGATIVGLNIRSHPDELAHCVALTRPRLLVAGPDFAEAITGLGGVDAPTWWLPERIGDPDSDWERRMTTATGAPPEVDHDPEDIHCVLFTSGTTGLPKGAMISERASVTRAFRCANWFGLGPDDGMVGWIPMFHTGGDECVKASLVTGGLFATLERADVETMYAAIARHRLTWAAMLPGVLTDFLHHPRRSEYDLSSLRIGFGYANMMPSVVEEFTSTFDAVFWDCFGQTESSFVLALDAVSPGQTPSLRKRPTPLLDIRIVDQDLNELPVGTPGECVVRGPSVMSGYVENPEASAEVFRGGWLHTGDVLVRNEDNTLTYVDRLKYLIKTGGENVYPAEIEQVLVAHPAIREASAISVPHDRWGETILAVVVLDDGASVTEHEIVAWCRERLAGFKTPRLVRILTDDELPRSGTGKIQRHELQRRFADAAREG